MNNDCGCRHFYFPTYNRDILTRTDHTNLLATPRGYRWYGPSGEVSLKKRAFRVKSKKCNARPELFPGMTQFMADIWFTLTPDLLLSLKHILEEEFRMESRSAVNFIVKQYLKSQRLRKMENSCFCCPTEEQTDFARNIAGALASKITQFTEMMTDASRSKRRTLLQRELLGRLQKMLGVEPCTDTPLCDWLRRIADGLAVWLLSLPGENRMGDICSGLVDYICLDVTSC
ncbi:uncharacterized protein [Halyomorpha halys]|uniref:uncharacterized protein isoform X2 n=1 Tax=Halyomorpha halys TaxID=286706 RepID=UPI0006D4E682|nr:uncharacterized protein LOC106685835 isoform X2 [Halyomorpha halys]